jgi:hypothetical protein
VAVVAKYMKDIVTNPSIWKSDFLNRTIKQEENRSRIYQLLIAQGVPVQKAHQQSLRRMKYE